MVAETRRIEKNYKVEIEWIRSELEAAVAAAQEAEENHKSEIARITAEAESWAHQAEAEANVRQQYQTKVEEAIANTQSAMFTLEETQKKLAEAEAKCQELENRARQAESRSHRLYMISKLTFSSAEEVIAGASGMSDENEKEVTVAPGDIAATPYSDNFSMENRESGVNGSTDYGDRAFSNELSAQTPSPFSDQFSERIRALFQAATRANASDDKNV
jgi:hypothetical protein